jgi:hypothetical protein
MAPNSCVTSGVFAHFLISGFDFAGPYRSAEVTFIFSEQQTESAGQHPALFAVAHPNCHAGFQATVFRKAIAGNSTNNTLRIVLSKDALMTPGFEECDGSLPELSADVNVGTTVARRRLRFIPLTTSWARLGGAMARSMSRLPTAPQGVGSVEDVDAICETPTGSLQISTSGSPSVPGVSGEDEDVSTFTGTFSPPSGTAELRYDLTTLGISNSEEVDGVGYR